MNLKKSISLVLTLCMVFSLFATFVFPVAAEGTTYTLIDTVEDLTAGTYYMGGVVTNDDYGPYQIFSGSVGTSSGKTDLFTSLYTYTDGVLATDSEFPAAAVVLAAVEGKENTYTIYVDGKGYITCTDYSANRRLNFADTACEWVVSNNANGGITFSSSSNGATTYMGINQGSSSSPTKSKFIRNYSNESTLSSGLVFFAEDVEEVVPVTSQVVDNWNHADWNTGVNAANGAYIYTDATVYAETNMWWWNHAAFAPTDVEGVYEVTEIAINGSTAAQESSLTVPENGFVWVGWSGAAAGSAGNYAFATIGTLEVGDKLSFVGVDIANKTTTADAYVEKYIDPNAPVNVALGKDYELSGCGNRASYYGDLTDGLSANDLNGDNHVNWFGFYCNGTDESDINAPDKVGTVIIDLGAMYDISSMRTKTIAQPSWGIAAAEAINFYTSVDGVEYTLAGSGVVSDEQGVGYWSGTECEVTAQFVKLEVKLAGTFAFIGEFEVYGKETPAPEMNEVVVDVTENAMLTDGLTGFDGNWGTVGATDVLLIANDKCTEMAMNVVVNYALGETKTIDALVLDFYHCAGVMIGYPEGKVLVEYSVDGVEYVALGEYDLAAAEVAVGSYGTVSSTLAFDAVDAAYVRATFVVGSSTGVLGDSPADGKVFWEFASLAEVAVNEAEADDDSFKDTYTYVDGVNKGTAQSREDGWESIPVVDFWYLVEDGVDTVTIKVAVDNDKVVAADTMLRIWVETYGETEKPWTTLYDFFVDADGKIYERPHGTSIEGGYTTAEYTVEGNDYFFTVVLDKAVVGIDGQYGLDIQLGQTGYNTLHSIEWDAFDNSLTPWTTTEFYEVFGKAPEVEYNEVVVDVTENAMLTDGKTGFAGGWNVGADATKVLLIANDKCTTNPMKVIVNYALGETKTIDALVLDFYHCAAVMIGYPEGKVLVEYSVDGVEYVALGEYDLEAATLSTAADGTVSSTLAFDAVDAAYVRATFVVGSSTGVLGDTPADGKVFWEFASLAEVAVNEVPAAPEYNAGWNVEYDDTQIKISSGNEAFVAALADNVWADGATSFGTAGVLLVQNLVCNNPELYPELTLVYNAGTAIDVNNIKVGLYVETNSMIGYPSKDAKVYVSTDGIEWTPVDSTTDIPESVFVQHGNSENSLGTYVANIEFATSTAQYVKVVFTYTDSPFDDPADYKPVYEFIAFTEAEVSYVEPSAELPEDATGLDVYGYTHTYINYVMYADTDMTLGELTAKYLGTAKDLNYFKVIVVNADGTVAATYLTLGRPDGVKTDFTVTAGQYVLALSADDSNAGRHEIADTVNVGDIVTLYNVDLTAAPGALTNAGFTVKAAASGDLNEVDGGALPAFNPMLGQNVVIPANTALSYTVAFEDGAFFALYDENVKVLVNGEAIDGEANLVKGDVVTLINASAEEYVAYPRCVPVIKGTMSNPFIIDVLGDITANVTEDIAMNGGAAFYTYTATADGKIVFTMLTETNWTYTVNNITAGIYGDTQWSDSDPVLKTWTVEVKAGDEVQISVAPYDPENPYSAPAGEIKFNVAFEAAKTFVTGEFSEGGELNQANVFAANAHNIWNKDFSGNSWWGVTVLEWNAEENAWEVVKVLLSGADVKDGTLTETQIALAAHVDNAAAYASITALQVGDIVYIWDAGVATTDKLVDGVDANGGFYTTDPEKTGTTALTYKAVEYLAGDVNMNGKIDANDYATIRKLVVGSLTEEDLSAKALELADVNGNGKIDANDYILVKRHVLGTYTIPAWEDVE